MLNTLNGGHKRRLYIAYYVRPTLSPGDPHRYHSGLLTFRTAKSDATVFHATTSPGSPWQFEAKVITPRTMRLVCLLYIGKLDHAITDDVLVDLLSNNVPVNNVDPSWNCLDWVYDSLTVLVATGVILEPLSCPPSKLWELGARYADDWRLAYNHNRRLVEPGTPIPCCDAFGNPLPSPLS